MYVCVLSVLSAQDTVRPHLSCLIDSEPDSVESFGDAVPLQREAVCSCIQHYWCTNALLLRYLLAMSVCA